MRILRVAAACLGLACADTGASPTPPVANLQAVSAADQQGPAGATVNDPPSVRAIASDGRPIAGVAVAFVATSGTLAAAHASTGADGVASVPWTLALGDGEVRATLGTLPPVVFRATGRPRGFDLTIRWQTPPTPEARVAVEQAEATLERIIWEDLPDATLDAADVCPLQGTPAATLSETVDDVLILARIGPMDGPGGAGAQGFPCLIRDPGTQTIVGFIRFDEADYPLLTEGLRREFALHEMVHALGLVPGILNITTPSGFSRNCLRLPSTGAPNTLVQDTHFSCANAVRAFDRMGGNRYTGLKVPLENGATRALGPNTLNHHWRKTSLANELMTGWFVAGQPGPLSLVTVGALADLGYEVVFDAAEIMSLPANIATTVLTNEAAPLVEWPGPTAGPRLHRARRRPPIN